MERLDSVIGELEAARNFATARFASEVNMPVEEFLLHFRVVMLPPEEESPAVSFRVEPIDD